jgi:putative peptidoglycan lipid II flippase
MPEQPVAQKTGSGATSWMASAAFLMVFATFMSGVTGLLRDVAIGARFDLASADAYFNASSVPDLMYFLVAGGALRTGFVPIFTKYMADGKESQAWRTFSSLFWLLALLSGLLAAVGILAAEPLARLISPGWVADHPEMVETCAELMRIMFPAQIFFALGGLLMGTLNAVKHFFWPAMGPIIYNCTIITGAIVAPWMLGLHTLAWAVLIGAFVGNFALQMFALRSRGGRVQALWAPNDEGVRRVILLALPVILGLAIAEINFVITKLLATIAMPEGGVSTLNYANHLWKFPARMFGAGIAIALFPALSMHYASGEEDQYRTDFSFGMRNVLFLTIPSVALMIAIPAPIVRLLFPAFDAASVAAIATTLSWFSLGIVPLGIVYVVARSFYARHDTVTPVWVGLISVVACVTSALLLIGPFKVAGLAMATSIAGIINAGLLAWLLQHRVGGLDGRRIVASVLRVLPPTVALAAVIYGANFYLEGVLGTAGHMAHLIAVAVPMLLGGLVFVVGCGGVRVEEMSSAVSLITRRFRK